jgi:hypothetical protein
MVRKRVVGGTTFSCQNTVTLSMTAIADADKLHHVARSIFGVISVKGAVIYRRSALLCGLCSNTNDLTYPHTKNSGRVKSGEFPGCHMGPSWPHQSKNSRTVTTWCGRAPSCRVVSCCVVILENFAYHTMHCAHCCSVTAMFLSDALAPPRGLTACKPSIHPTRIYFPLIFRQTS